MIRAEIQDAELAEYLSVLPDDDMIHFSMAQGRIRGALFHGTHFVNQMRAQHQTGILESYILGQASLCAALLIPALMKGREHITWRYEVESSRAQGFSVEADSAGWVRGYLFTNHIPMDRPLDNWDMTPFLGGEGIMSIQIVREHDKYPQTSSVNTTGNIAEDLVFFFDRSEQLPTALSSSIQMDTQGRIIGAGGMFVQIVPETGGYYAGAQKRGAAIDSAPHEEEDALLIARIEERYRSAPSLGTWFSQGRSCENLLQELFHDFAPVVALHRGIVYDCPCSHGHFLRYIQALPATEIADIRKKGEALTVTCRNCNSVYTILPSEI